MNTPKRLLITTLDMRDPGGVQFSTKKFLEWVKLTRRFQTEIAYGALRAGDPLNVTVASLLHGRFAPAVAQDAFGDIPTHRVGGYFPKIEFLRYRANRRLWQNLLRRFDLQMVISGYAFDALPLVYNGSPFALWVATDLDSEREITVSTKGVVKRLVNQVQMRELRRLETLALHKADWVYASTEWMRKRLIERGASREKSSVLSNPTDSQKWKPRDIERPDPPTILWAARLSDARKNTEFLLRAFRRLVTKVPSARLKLIGPVVSNALTQKVREWGLESQVEFTGDLTEEKRVALFQSAHAFAVPSLQEGLCISAIEALAMELPVVSTRCGGPETFITPGKTGFLVDSEQEMADALEKVLLNPAMRKDMGHQGRRLVEAEFSNARFYSQLDAVLPKLWNYQ